MPMLHPYPSSLYYPLTVTLLQLLLTACPCRDNLSLHQLPISSQTIALAPLVLQSQKLFLSLRAFYGILC